jgi:outer membrane protein assembly factor BamB
VRWRLDGEGPAYGPPVVGAFASVKQVVTQSEESLMGVDLATGARLWQRPFKVPWDNTILTPVISGDHVLLSANDIDLQAFKVIRTGTTWTTEVAWSLRQPMYMSSPVLVSGRLYGLTHLRRGQLFAADPQTGKVIWTSPAGLGEQAVLIAAGKHLLVLTDGAELRVLATGDTYREVAKYTVADSATWAHPALLKGGLFLVKDAQKLTLWSFAPPRASGPASPRPSTRGPE